MAVLLGWTVLSPRPSRAVGGLGGEPGQFLNYGAGARALGMGGAFYSISDDATASLWNPAGLPQVERREFTAMSASLFADTSLTSLAYAQPTPTAGTFGLSLVQLTSSGFERIAVTVDPNSQDILSVQNLGTFADTERAFGFAWGRNVTESMSIGVNFKYMTRTLDTSSDTHQSFDLGVLKSFGPYYRIGLGIDNVASHASGDTEDKLPLTLRLGNSLRLFKDKLVLGLDGSRSQNGGNSWRLGGEYWLLGWWALRFGIMGAPELQETDFGFGLKYKYLALDISQGVTDLGSTTRVSATLRFGESNRERHDAEVRRMLQEGYQAFRRGDFARSVELLSQAADADPSNKELRGIMARLETAIGFIPKSAGADETSNFIRKGVIAYVDGKDLRTAVNSLRYAFNRTPKDDRLLALLNIAEREAGVTELTRKPEGPEIFTFIDQKIYDARQAIYEGRYDLAVRRTQDVLDLEPRNETALEIMGSAFFLMDQRDKARIIWQKVLEINPANKVVADFLSQLGQP